MNYQYKLYKLDSGHTIVTPYGKPITESEYREYFSIVSCWLKVIDPEAYKKISPDPDNSAARYSMIKEMLRAFHQGPDGECYLDKRSLAFIFVASYYVQIRDCELISSNLSHVMGNALLEWLPIPELVEHYLALSADAGIGSNLRDGLTLAELFCPGISMSKPSFDKDAKKALKYARILYDNPRNKHDLNRYDFLYAKALFLNYPQRAEECMNIVKANVSGGYNEENQWHLLNYLSLGLEIMSSIEGLQNKLDLEFAEKMITEAENDHPVFAEECDYWLAKCYINGKNNQTNPERAVQLLHSAAPWRPLRKKIGAALAGMALDANNVEEALSLIEATELQCRPTYDGDEDIAQVMERIPVTEEQTMVRDDLHIIFDGRYGESFRFTRIEGDKYVGTCLETGMVDVSITHDGIDEVYDAYVNVGRPDFDITDRAQLMNRAITMGQKLRTCYNHINSTNPFERLLYSAKVQRILQDVEVLQLNDEEYVDWFLTHGSVEGQEYIRFMLRAKKWLVQRTV